MQSSSTTVIGLIEVVVMELRFSVVLTLKLA